MSALHVASGDKISENSVATCGCMASVLGLYLLKVGLETMVHADRTKTCLKITNYTNVEIQHNAYRRGGVCCLEHDFGIEALNYCGTDDTRVHPQSRIHC
jgi:hypothetical protein